MLKYLGVCFSGFLSWLAFGLIGLIPGLENKYYLNYLIFPLITGLVILLFVFYPWISNKGKVEPIYWESYLPSKVKLALPFVPLSTIIFFIITLFRTAFEEVFNGFFLQLLVFELLWFAFIFISSSLIDRRLEKYRAVAKAESEKRSEEERKKNGTGWGTSTGWDTGERINSENVVTYAEYFTCRRCGRTVRFDKMCYYKDLVRTGVEKKPSGGKCTCGNPYWYIPCTDDEMKWTIWDRCK